MASQKSSTTSNSGLFDTSLEGQLTFEQLSGPRLFTPAPLPQTQGNIHQHVPVMDANSSTGMQPYIPLHTTPTVGNGINNQHNPRFPASSFPTTSLLQSTPYKASNLQQASTNQTPPFPYGMVSPVNPNLSLVNQAPPVNILPVTSVFTPTASNPFPSETYQRQPQRPPMQRPMQVVPPQPQQAFPNQQNQLPQPQKPAEPLTQNINLETSPPSPDYNISPFPGATSSTQTDVGATPLVSTLPVTAHWFYYKNSTHWVPFSYVDSNNLERLFHSSQPLKSVSTNGGRYDVDLNSLRQTAIYWNEAPCQVRRCTWFYKGDAENKLIPYESDVAEKLENEYIAMMKKGIFNIRIDIVPGKFVIFHNPNVLVQYVSNVEHDWTGEDSKVRPKVVKRGITEIQEQIERGESAEIDHLVFVVHGIGPVADLKMRTIVECVDDLRRNSLNLTSTHGFQVKDQAACRVEYLPIQWYSCLRDDRYGIDKQLKALSLPSINKLRNFTNETLTDILFFSSPIYCQKICDTVVGEMNRLFKMFRSRNPSYAGAVSVVGHSLGSCILFDILANQIDQTTENSEAETYEDFGEVVESIPSNTIQPSSSPPSLNDTSTSFDKKELPSITQLLTKLNLTNLESMFTEEQIDTETLMMCSDADLRDLGIPFGPRKKIIAHIKDFSSSTVTMSAHSTTPVQSNSFASCNESLTRGTQTRVSKNAPSLSVDSVQCTYKKGSAGIGQPLVIYPKLEFQTDGLFCLGSPLGLFLTCRGVSSIGASYKLPKCPKFLNIFHPYDPVVYRLEPLVNKLIDIPPVLIPHHKGRKRFHLEIKENLSRVGANLKSGFIDAVNRTWSSINDFAKAHRTGVEQQTEEITGETAESSSSSDVTQESIDSEIAIKEEALDFGVLNNGRRIDYVLQEKPFEVLNEYLFALSSHTCYWTSEDTALLILKQVYGDV
ncbi:phospholipase DDHD2-like isoform X1 [Hydractinia symbiolongicarpus]|uniref:phospholipase DDHD2-like isoform X1 n=2 Tax=Hydractinia symbiolongicarpus TaxID=13093 RepID=UPI00254C0395|nr:phospholipase DDHD2-like isoform X1 [Hydractinia symbiolongicarpus]